MEPPASLFEIEYDETGMHYPSHRRRASEDELPEILAEAQRIFREAEAGTPPGDHVDLSADFEALRWFPLPDDRTPVGT